MADINTKAEHIAHLSMGPDQDEQATDLSDIQHDVEELPEGGTFDQEDQVYSDEEEAGIEEEDVVDWQAKFEESERAADGRLAYAQGLREDLRVQKENIEQLRQVWMSEQKEKVEERKTAAESQRRQDEIERYGEDVVNDKHVAYMRDSVARIESQIENERQEREGRMRASAEQMGQAREQQAYQNQALMALDAQEKEFSAENPDYEEAYEFARQVRRDQYARRGYNQAEAEEAVQQDEIYLMNEQLQIGGNVAAEVYNWALDYGWEGPAEEAQEQEYTEADQRSDFDKIRNGLSQGSIRNMQGGNPNSEGQYMSREQFYSTVPEHIRAMVHANADQFEELGRTGRIRVTW